MKSKISVVINTLDVESEIERVLKSVKWADEIIVCDMHSSDKTVSKAEKLGAKVVLHKQINFVEPARNYAISKASGDWILVLDPDEEVGEELAKRLREIAETSDASYVEIPRKNIIFSKWMKASFWWPDYNIRFFRKGAVVWSDKIHRPPQASGRGSNLPAEESLAINHYHYQSVSQFILRMNRYTDVQAEELVDSGYKFRWRDLIEKPLSEFLGRFFANRGFEDGLHGLALSLLQAFSFLVMYLKIWENEKFAAQEIGLADLKQVSKKGAFELNYWLKYVSLSANPLKRLLQKARNKVI